MKAISTAAAAIVLLASNTAAAVERFDCHLPNSTSTIIEIDRAAKVYTLSENGKTAFARQPVCDALAQIVGDIAKSATNPRCTIAFGTDVVAADYVALDGPANFMMAIALNTKTMTLTAIGRVGTIDGFAQTAPCQRTVPAR